MTRDEILNMPAGREMDYLIAEKVLELSILKDGTGILLPIDLQVKNYSTDIAAAWGVVEKFPTMSLTFRGKYWFCDLNQVDFDYTQADTAPLAICRAALLTLVEE